MRFTSSFTFLTSTLIYMEMASLYFHTHNGGLGFTYTKENDEFSFEMSHFGNSVTFGLPFNPSDMIRLITMFLEYLEFDESDGKDPLDDYDRFHFTDYHSNSSVFYDENGFRLTFGGGIQITLNPYGFNDNIEKVKEKCNTFLCSLRSK